MTQTLTDAAASSVRAEMAKARITQRAAAAAIGLSEPQLGRRVRGLYPFNVPELAGLATVVGGPIRFEAEGTRIEVLPLSQPIPSEAVSA